MKLFNILGLRFGRLTVIKKYYIKNGVTYWPCVCTCGSLKNVSARYLVDGRITSCGCYHKESIKKHNKYGSPEYHSWDSMKQRCLNPNCDSYHRYGGRGIKICSSWLSFKNFYKDMGDKPSPKHTIGRINNDGNYEPSNCRWETRSQQNNNTSKTHFITHPVTGEKLSCTQWSLRLGKNPKLVGSRLSKGWTEERAITQEPHK